MLVILEFLDAGTPGLTRNASLPGARLQQGATGVASTEHKLKDVTLLEVGILFISVRNLNTLLSLSCAF